MLIFSVVIFVFSTLTLSPRPLCLEKWGVMTPQLLWERRPCLEVLFMVRLSIITAFGEWRHYQDYYPDVMLPTYSVLLIIIIRQLFSQATVGLIHSFM